MDIGSLSGAPALSALLTMSATALGGVPAVFWQLDLRKNELTFLGGGSRGALDEQTTLILKNPAHARAAVLAEDQNRFFECLDRIRGVHPAATIVRVRDGDGLVRWIALAAMPDPGTAMRCVGLLAECSGLVDLVVGATADADLDDKIALFDNPVLLVSVKTRHTVLANPAARALFGERLDGPAALAFDDLLLSSAGGTAAEIVEALVFHGQWSGALTVHDDRGAPHLCAARVRALSHRGQNLLWVCLMPEAARGDDRSGEGMPPEDEASPGAIEAFAAADSIPALLRAFVEHQPAALQAEAVMRSRIFIAENRVVVTGVAPSLVMPAAETFPYEGSIAENIVRFGLDHLIVEDTSRSIKPIDWVLFIPKGIRSYFAVPFFDGGMLKNVFIVCSTEVGRFTERNVRAYGPLLPAVEAAFNRLEETRAT
ncbi:hypothetical protein [Rhodoplanes roseus]|uniref:PAS domain-containing protein n=1 Tax=Rhodoplanes roseus TaxID=29409 RepID=A0A327L3K4_9BRAD|nr:hypothetical protein [Rhodoplanes roseus]RAI44976.1 hypothetical protein CH341_06385 [Rhodoplanes roseus]